MDELLDRWWLRPLMQAGGVVRIPVAGVPNVGVTRVWFLSQAARPA